MLLDDVSFDVYAIPNDLQPGRTWPPNRFQTRNDRLADLRGLWAGQLPRGVDLGPNPVVWNGWRSYSLRLANMLIASPPEVPQQLEDPAEGVEPVDAPLGQLNPLEDLAFDAIIDMTRFGGVVLVGYDDGIAVIDPASWYPGEEGEHYIVRTYLEVDPQNPEAVEDNRIEITMIADTSITTYTHAFQGHTIREVLGAPMVGMGALEVVPRDPRMGIWGASKYLELYSPIVEICRRYSRNSRILDLYSGPVPVFRQGDVDARARFGVQPDEDDDVAQRKILEGQIGMLEADSISLPEDILDVSFLQPNVQGTTYALTQVHDLREQVRAMTGLPDLSGQTVSGEALKRIFVDFYAESRALQNALRAALERLLGEPVVWDHLFDSGLMQSSPDVMQPGPAVNGSEMMEAPE